ncbi:protein phosphatase CheZ [Photobacterium halotolerans]|uniref:Protein phosphatase CheZ n=1 Tax=Photobacterium halotolerans TaxID=265726 RepID=A0A7X4W9I8_9GAMM|nr:protein phosphatase CheZ [Photobacterium halotolerans]NAW64701.1 protein phosphatase [Photobacterium halotolerans]NAW85954.1 protein phosphatase [Photobacterium halotolerans]NAX46818.1 protein phosphatase [Photobacterium halotolerans]
MISLEQAKQLVALLEKDQQEDADELFRSLVSDCRDPMYLEVGKLTRQLHDSLQNFRLDPRIADLATTDIPDARGRLNYVIDKTEEAANRTMDAVEGTLPIADLLRERLMQVKPQWQSLMHGEITLGEFKQLCHDIDALLVQLDGDSEQLHRHLTDILMAQDFQDLTGQVIRRVIELVHEVEHQLVEILKAAGIEQSESSVVVSQKDKTLSPEGPIINSAERTDVMSTQDDVDDLLSSLGF